MQYVRQLFMDQETEQEGLRKSLAHFEGMVNVVMEKLDPGASTDLQLKL